MLAMTLRTLRDFMPVIQIKLEDGQVTDVAGLTPEIAVEVFNYDVDKFEKHLLSRDENGSSCEIKEWHAPE
jgi:hypothetical protein